MLKVLFDKTQTVCTVLHPMYEQLYTTIYEFTRNILSIFLDTNNTPVCNSSIRPAHSSLERQSLPYIPSTPRATGGPEILFVLLLGCSLDDPQTHLPKIIPSIHNCKLMKFSSIKEYQHFSISVRYLLQKFMILLLVASTQFCITLSIIDCYSSKLNH